MTARSGFTMLEIMLAVMILSIMTIVSTMTFRSIVSNWRVATEMADNMQRVDYVTAQIAGALRSAYFPTSGKGGDADGFALIDDGNDPDSSDRITWTKLGPAIVGRSSRFGKSPHQITLSVKEATRDEPGGLVADVISRDLRPDDFDEEDEANWDHFMLSPNVQGFNCRVLDKEQPFKDNKANWVDKWDTSNCIPRRVQITLWMKPVEEGKDPYPVVRVVEIPLWNISQNPVTKTSEDGGGKGKKGTGTGTSGTTGGASGNKGPTGGPGGPGGGGPGGGAGGGPGGPGGGGGGR